MVSLLYGNISLLHVYRISTGKVVFHIKRKNLAKLGNGLGESPTAMVGEGRKKNRCILKPIRALDLREKKSILD